VSIVFEDNVGTLRIWDDSNQRQYRLTIPPECVLSEPSTDVFSTNKDREEGGIDFAVEETRSFAADTFGVPKLVAGYIRRLDGSMVSDIHDADQRRFPDQSYVLELDAHLKVFVRFDGAFHMIYEEGGIRILLDEETDIYVGARSVSRTPTETVWVDESLDGLYRVVNYLGGSLVTRSPERSWTTLRDHPPRVKVGDAGQRVPDRVPDTGVEIRVPRDREYLYAVAPLAYYLDAHVVPGDEPVLRADGRVVAEFSGASSFAFSQDVQSVLKHQFTLDVLTRVEGFYPLPLFERELLSYRDRDIAWGELYRAALSERVDRYQEIPRAVTREIEPTWRSTATITDAAENVESLPYLIDELALVQPQPEAKVSTDAVEFAETVSSFLRAPDAIDDPGENRFVSPPDVDTLESMYVGNGVPVGSSKVLVEGYEADLSRTRSGSDISIHVVCNNEEMRHEVEEDLYGGREEFPFEVETSFDLSVSELREVWRSDTDFVHYIGHLDGEYFYCRDGRLDPASLNEVGVRAFLLNGCESFEQGEALVLGGASGGIATVSRVADDHAARIGVMLAKLLDEGFSIRGALELARRYQLIGSQYVGVGDSELSLVQSDAGTPAVTNVQATARDKIYSVVMETYPSDVGRMGALYRPFLGRLEKYFISGGDTAPVRVSERELLEFLEQDYLAPVVFDGEFLWSPELLERIGD